MVVSQRLAWTMRKAVNIIMMCWTISYFVIAGYSSSITIKPLYWVYKIWACARCVRLQLAINTVSLMRNVSIYADIRSVSCQSPFNSTYSSISTAGLPCEFTALEIKLCTMAECAWRLAILSCRLWARKYCLFKTYSHNTKKILSDHGFTLPFISLKTRFCRISQRYNVHTKYDSFSWLFLHKIMCFL